MPRRRSQTVTGVPTSTEPSVSQTLPTARAEYATAAQCVRLTSNVPRINEKLSKTLTFSVGEGLASSEHRHTVSFYRRLDDDTSFFDLHQTLLSTNAFGRGDADPVDMTVSVAHGTRRVYFGLLSTFPVSYSVSTDGDALRETISVSAIINVVGGTET